MFKIHSLPRREFRRGPPKFVVIDFEAYSEAGFIWNEKKQKWLPLAPKKKGIQAVGTAAYCQHPSTEVLILCYKFDGDSSVSAWIAGQPPPTDLLDYIKSGGLVVAAFSFFEFELWLEVCHARLGWPHLPVEQTSDVLAKARAYGVSGKLDQVTKYLQVGEYKDSAGKDLINKYSIPRNPTKSNPARRLMAEPLGWFKLNELGLLTPEQQSILQGFINFVEYCKQDVAATAAIVLPDLIPAERQTFIIDQKINARGVHTDTLTVDACQKIIEETEQLYNREARELTNGTIETVNQLEKLRKWLNAIPGAPQLPNMQETTINDFLEKTSLPPVYRRLLEIRHLLGSAAVKKIRAMKFQRCSDNRLRGVYSYWGAFTGRFAGREVQTQNLKVKGPKCNTCPKCNLYFTAKHANCPLCSTLANKASWGVSAVESAINVLRSGDRLTVEYIWGDSFEVIGGCIRSMFIAAPGKQLVCADYSAIESMVLAWLSGEIWKQEVFLSHRKIYEMTASKISGVPFETIIKYKEETGGHHPIRKLGKVGDLASGFKGWVNAWLNFNADEFLSVSEIKESILKWRKASPMTVKFWGEILAAAIKAVSEPKTWTSYRLIKFYYDPGQDVLFCRLPSGRDLCYHEPKLQPGTTWDGNPCIEITFLSRAGKSSGRTTLYDGLLTENIVQAVARDFFTHVMPYCEAAGYYIVLHTHDEITAEVPLGFGSIKDFESLMNIRPPWAPEWPLLAAGGWMGLRFRK